MTAFIRLWIVVFGIAVTGAAKASQPAPPPIDLVAEVQQASTGSSCMDCGTHEVTLTCGVVNLYDVFGEEDPSRWVKVPASTEVRGDACLRSSCTVFSGTDIAQ